MTNRIFMRTSPAAVSAATAPTPVPTKEPAPYGLEWLPNPFGGEPRGRMIPYALKAGDTLASGATGQAKLGSQYWTLSSTAASDAIDAARQLLEQNPSIDAIGWGPIPSRAPQASPTATHLFDVTSPKGVELASALRSGTMTAERQLVLVTTEGGSEAFYHVSPMHGVVTRSGTFEVADPTPRYEPPYRDTGGGW